MFKNALAHVQRNHKALIIYAAISASYFGIRVAIEYYLIGTIDPNTISSNQKFYLLISGITTAIVIAIAQTLAFTRLATDIDRPLWKSEPGFHTFFKYTSFWITLNYIYIAFPLLIGISPISDDAKISLSIFHMIYEVIFIPFGATVMFYGNVTRHEFAKALNTMIRQLPRFILLALFGLFFQSIINTLQIGLPSTTLPILAVIDAYFSCFVFAYTWEICRFNREEEDNIDDMEF